MSCNQFRCQCIERECPATRLAGIGRSGNLTPVDERGVEFRTEAAHRHEGALATRPVDRNAGDTLQRFGYVRVGQFADVLARDRIDDSRSEEQTSELQSLMR